MRLLLMADGKVGLAIAKWLFREYPSDVALTVTTSVNDIWNAAREAGNSAIVFDSADSLLTRLDALEINLDLGFLAWWSQIINPPLLNRPANGFINTHPSLLPHNRGKHYNFWALVEQAPFGVTLHTVDTGVDSGDIVAQRPIPYSWEDTGKSLYDKAQKAMVELFCESYPVIRRLDFPRRKQDLRKGSFHRAVELDPASRVEIDGSYRARDLLNLLRARTFDGNPACWFEDGRETYEVRISIQKKRT